jgi:hypothetical protein
MPNILELILTVEDSDGLGSNRFSVREFKKMLKDMDVDYVIDREEITQLWHAHYERYRCNQCWLELKTLQWFNVTANYNVIVELINNSDATIELRPKHKYFEVTLQQGEQENDEIQTTEESRLPFT